MLWAKNNSYKEFDNEKKFLRLENSPPRPHNFCNGPSLNITVTSLIKLTRPRFLPFSHCFFSKARGLFLKRVTFLDSLLNLY